MKHAWWCRFAIVTASRTETYRKTTTAHGIWEQTTKRCLICRREVTP